MNHTTKQDPESNDIQSLTRLLPFSFRYGGEPSSGFLESWTKQSESHKKKGDVVRQTSSFRDPKTGLACRMEMDIFSDYPAAEWVLTFKNEGQQETELLEDIEQFKKKKIKVDYYWIDAGWFGIADENAIRNWGTNLGEWNWGNVLGDWRCNPYIYPQGFKPISDAAQAAGMKFLLWIEPERAVCGAPITRAHPEWFFGDHKPGQELLFNLGHPEARRWMTDTVSDLIAENNIACIRFDFNTFPLAYWSKADEPNRPESRFLFYRKV